MANIQRGFHHVGVAVAVLIALAGGSWTAAAGLFARSLSDWAILGIGVIATVVLALATWGFYCLLGWFVAGFADAKRITRAIGASGVTVENQAAAMRRRDLDAAHKIIGRHAIMHGTGMAIEDVGQARVAMAGDIADALAAERGGLPAA